MRTSHTLKHIFQASLCALVATTLSACGGGGGNPMTLNSSGAGTTSVSSSDTENILGVPGISSTVKPSAGATGGSPPFISPPSVVPPLQNGSAMVTWQAPATRADGTVIASLQGYRIYYGAASGNYSSSLFVAGENQLNGVITGLGRGTWYFTVAAVDASGNESSFGYELSKSL